MVPVTFRDELSGAGHVPNGVIVCSNFKESVESFRSPVMTWAADSLGGV